MKRNIKIFGIYIVISVLTILVFLNGFLDGWQEKIFDKFFINQKNSNEIVIFAVDNESISQIGVWPWSRKVFANAISKIQTAKVIGLDINFSEYSQIDPDGDLLLALNIEKSKPKIILPTQLNEKTGEIVEPLPIFKKSSFQGFVNLIIDGDGIVRKSANSESFNNILVLQFSNNLYVPDFLRIDYFGGPKKFTTLPIIDLLTNKVPESLYKDKIVLIGATAPDLHDYFQTPFGLVSGVEINANIVNTLLNQNFYNNLSPFLSVLILLILNFIITILIIKIKRVQILLVGLITIFLIINFTGALLFSNKIIFPVLYLNISFLITSGFLITFQYLTESKEKKFIYESFKKYLSKELINELLKDPSKLKLGGEKRKVTILFSDIRGFTKIAESMTPEKLVSVMNNYFAEMSDIIIGSGGLIEKYIGDAIMAFWGAPVINLNQTKDACLSALRMVSVVEKINENWKSECIPHDFNIGVGINTGEVIVGNMGSSQRFNYGIVGDNVNFTSRLEGLNKIYGTNIIISESIKSEIENFSEFRIRKLDTVIVKGKKETRQIFELITKPIKQDILDKFYEGQKFYVTGNWDMAIKIFSVLAEVDGPSKVYLERCEDFKKNPPQDWNGVYEFKNK